MLFMTFNAKGCLMFFDEVHDRLISFIVQFQTYGEVCIEKEK